MRGQKLFILIVLLAVALAGPACEFSVSTANIADAWMSTDQEGTNRTAVFAQDEVFYAQVDLRNAPADTTLKAVWIAVDVEGVDPNLVIDESEFTFGSGQVHFSLSNTDPWPVGTYRVEIYLNGELDRGLDFEVR